MQFSSILSTLSLAAAAAVPANTFSLMTIHSGSDVQYQGVKLSSDNHLSLNGETDVTFSIDSEGLLYGNGHHVDIFQGALMALDNGYSSAQWSVEDSHLKYEGMDAFVVCPNINSNIMFAGHGVPSTCENPIGVALRALDSN